MSIRLDDIKIGYELNIASFIQKGQNNLISMNSVIEHLVLYKDNIVNLYRCQISSQNKEKNQIISIHNK